MPQIVVAPNLLNLLDEDGQPYAVPLAGFGYLADVLRGKPDGTAFVISDDSDCVLQNSQECGLVAIRKGVLHHKMPGKEEIRLGRVHGSLIGVKFDGAVQFMTLFPEMASLLQPARRSLKAH